jgi:hypothetical protein
MPPRNKRALQLLSLLLGGIILFASVILFDTYVIGPPIEANPTPDPLEADLTELISKYESGEVASIDLSTVTSFSWDRVYVFIPYTTPTTIDRSVGLSWRKLCRTEIETAEGINLLIFTYKQKAVHCLEYPIPILDFSPLAKYSSGIPIQDANFLLDGVGQLVLATAHE